MSEDELQKKMDFIVEQQAQLVVSQRKADERIPRLKNIVVTRYKDTESKLNALVDAQNALVDTQIRTETNLSELTGAQLRTDDRLNTFITVVERFISEGHDGKK